jgi:hypothetical protein
LKALQLNFLIKVEHGNAESQLGQGMAEDKIFAKK